MMYYYDENAIINAFINQAREGSNYLTVRFNNSGDYWKAKYWDTSTISRIFTSIGYSGSYYFWANDNMHTISYGLYA